jgi:hypothetical protein
MESLKMWIILSSINILLLIWRYGLKDFWFYENKIAFSLLPLINLIHLPILLIGWYIELSGNRQQKKEFGKYYDEVKILNKQYNHDVLIIERKHTVGRRKGKDNCEKYIEKNVISSIKDNYHNELKKIRKRINVDQKDGIDSFEIKKQEIIDHRDGLLKLKSGPKN